MDVQTDSSEAVQREQVIHDPLEISGEFKHTIPDPPKDDTDATNKALDETQNSATNEDPERGVSDIQDDETSTKDSAHSKIEQDTSVNKHADGIDSSQELAARLESIEAKFSSFAKLLGQDSSEDDTSCGSEDEYIKVALELVKKRRLARKRRQMKREQVRASEKDAAVKSPPEKDCSSQDSDASQDPGSDTEAMPDLESESLKVLTPGHETFDLDEISKEAMLQGEQALIQWVGWEEFIRYRNITYSETTIEAEDRETAKQNILRPIDVISSEPEPHVIREIKSREKDIHKLVPSCGRPTERGRPDEQTMESIPVPERIRIRSEPLGLHLNTLFEDKTDWSPIKDGSVIFLRPYKELIYSEGNLRRSLEALNKLFDSDKKHGGDDLKKNGPEYSPLTTLLHLRCLVQFIEEELKPKIHHFRSDVCRKVTFHDLWFLFKPGDKVVEQNEKQAYRVVRIITPPHEIHTEQSARWRKREERSSESFTIRCVYIDFDGEKLGPVSKKFTISPFDEAKSIRSLAVYPLRFSKKGNIREDLVKRGTRLLSLSAHESMYYNGHTLDTREEVDSQVVIDFSEALMGLERAEWVPQINDLNTDEDREIAGDCQATCCRDFEGMIRHPRNNSSTYTDDFIKSLIPENDYARASLLLSPYPIEELRGELRNNPTEDERMVMTYRVFGFVLRSRKWAKLDLAFLKSESEASEETKHNALDELQLPDGHLYMVKSLVTQHFRGKNSTSLRDTQTDMIKGKGKGLIILLHGAPGVGKTTTAEGVAQHFQKPLFQITCGDLGSNARDVEAELEKNFTLASRWGCILLLDEADVFLSARERTDFERNGLVAVFLRILEYYSGILFLTTNRIGDFDEAFASRIHMTLYYPPLSKEMTINIFRLNMERIEKRLEKQDLTLQYDSSAIERFAEDHFVRHMYNRWNGRQIRNLCQTALSLAEYDSIQKEKDAAPSKKGFINLQIKDHFEKVQNAYLEFAKYLGDIRGTKGDERAYDLRLRARPDGEHQAMTNPFARHLERPPAPPQNRYGQNDWSGHGRSDHDYYVPGTSQSQGTGYAAPAPPNSYSYRDQQDYSYPEKHRSQAMAPGQPALQKHQDPYRQQDQYGPQEPYVQQEPPVPYSHSNQYDQRGGQGHGGPPLPAQNIAVGHDRSGPYSDGPLNQSPMHQPRQPESTYMSQQGNNASGGAEQFGREPMGIPGERGRW